MNAPEQLVEMIRASMAPEEKERNLRDWFAGMALQGINAAPMNRFPELKNETDTAIAAYTMADAMLAARKEGK